MVTGPLLCRSLAHPIREMGTSKVNLIHAEELKRAVQGCPGTDVGLESRGRTTLMSERGNGRRREKGRGRSQGRLSRARTAGLGRQGLPLYWGVRRAEGRGEAGGIGNTHMVTAECGMGWLALTVLGDFKEGKVRPQCFELQDGFLWQQ